VVDDTYAVYEHEDMGNGQDIREGGIANMKMGTSDDFFSNSRGLSTKYQMSHLK